MSKYATYDEQGRLTGFMEVADPPPGERNDSTLFRLEDNPRMTRLGDHQDIEEANLPNLIVRNNRIMVRDPLPKVPAPNRSTVRANNSEEVVISALPKNTNVKIVPLNADGSDAEPYGSGYYAPGAHVWSSYEATLADGRLRAAFTLPGRYRIEIDPFPYRPFKVFVNAHD